jgi:hypothetical protein
VGKPQHTGVVATAAVKSQKDPPPSFLLEINTSLSFHIFPKNQSGDKRMDKLLCPRLNENSIGRN